MGNQSKSSRQLGLGLVMFLGLGASYAAIGCAVYSDDEDEVANEGAFVIGANASALRLQVSDRWRQIVQDGNARGFRETSTTGGTHNPGSLHAQGRAVDFSVRNKTSAEVEEFISEMQGLGYIVRDERTRPPNQPVWSGPHIHVEDRRP